VHLLRWEVPDVRHRIVPDEGIAAEIERFHATLVRARERLHQLRADGDDAEQAIDAIAALIANKFGER
jgi:hypothetical protein